jgi:hypothetical protein
MENIRDFQRSEQAAFHNATPALSRFAKKQAQFIVLYGNASEAKGIELSTQVAFAWAEVRPLCRAH